MNKNLTITFASQSLVCILICTPQSVWSQTSLYNAMNIVDLSDLNGDLPLDVVSSTQILWQTQNWEHSTLGNPSWPAGGHESLGYPTMVKNTHGLNPDGKYYLYYAHHDPTSGIGSAVANSITGPYTKPSIAHEVLGSGWTDSQVLVNPLYRPGGMPVDWIGHYSSPSVVWNEDEDLWFMYFHYYNHYWGGAGEPAGEAWSANNPGMGHQMTALATTPDLSSHNWTMLTDPAWSRVSAHNIVPVLPTTDETWMESQSSYHAIQRLPDGQWLAFLRGTPITGGPTVGFGTSDDGRTWDYFPENPVIAPGKSWTVDASEYRPKFVGYLGENGSGEDEYLVAWAEHSNPHVIYSKTTDFKTFQRDPRGYANWGTGDGGPVDVTREGDNLYLFSGKFVHTMELSVLDPTAFEWNTNGSGSWLTSTNWSPAGVPDGNNIDVTFGDAVTIPATVVVNSAVQAKTLRFDHNRQYRLTSGQLTVDADNGDGLIDVVQGSHEIDLDLHLGGATEVRIAANAELALTGELYLNNQTLTKTGSGILRVDGTIGSIGGSLRGSAGMIQGDGALGGRLINLGSTVAPGSGAGVLAIAEDYIQTSGGRLQMQIGGTGAGEFDKLVASVMQFGGVLEVSLINGFTPSAGDQFDLLDFRFSAGNFTSLQLPSGVDWDTSSLTASGVLSVVVPIVYPDGDYNATNVVNIFDLNLALFNWGVDGADLPSNWTHQRPAPGTTVGLSHLNAVLFNWNAMGSEFATVPEPASCFLAWLAAGIIGSLGRTQRTTA